MSHVIIPLEDHFNNAGISFSESCHRGDFDGLGNSFPAEELPAFGKKVEFNGTPFLFPCKSDGTPDNMALEGQQIVVPLARYQALMVLGASDSARYADGAFEDHIYFCSRDKRQARRLSLKDWICIAEQRAGGREALRCPFMNTPSSQISRSEKGYETLPTLWLEEIALDARDYLCSIIFPDNPCMHIFAMTLRLQK